MLVGHICISSLFHLNIIFFSLVCFFFLFQDGSTITGQIRTGNVQLSNRHSVALTDVTVLSQEPIVPIRFKGEDKMEHLRVISIQDVAGTSLLFLANNFREAELLVCGLKLLLERETVRLGVRGGLPMSTFGARNLEGAMSPSAARGFRDMPSQPVANRRKEASRRSSNSGYISSDAGEGESIGDSVQRDKPDSRRAWGNVPGRNYMRGQAATLLESENGHNEQGVPKFVHGQQIVRDIARNVRLPLPLPLCRVLLLDSSSPLVQRWEEERGDKNFDKSRWAFPPASQREHERHRSEHQLIASGSMCGAYRTISFDRPRYGSIVRLTETHLVDADDSKKLLFTVEEMNPRRGFSICIRVLLRAHKENVCDSSVIAEIRPVGKDMSNQAAVHKAFLLVVDEIRLRYGTEGAGLLAGFMRVVDTIPEGGGKTSANGPASPTGLFPRTNPVAEEKKTDGPSASFSTMNGKKESSSTKSGLVSFEDMLKTGRESPENSPGIRPSTPSLVRVVPEPDPSKRIGMRAHTNTDESKDDFFAEMGDLPPISPENKDSASNAAAAARLIEVKPLPKIRLSLMPSPREEDEEDLSNDESPSQPESSSSKADSKKSKKGKIKRKSFRPGKRQSRPRSSGI